MCSVSSYSWCCWCSVPSVHDHPQAKVHHITDVPEKPIPKGTINIDYADRIGHGTKEEPFKIYRHSSLVGQSNLKHLRFICMSDTHNDIEKIPIPNGDVLIHCGDAVNCSTSRRDIDVFNKFIGTLPHPYKLFVSGNHCVCLDPKRPERSQRILSNMTYLQDDLVNIEGVKIYGTPWRPKRGCFYRAEAFGYDARRIRQDKWAKIPEDIDFLLTHGPAYSIRDYNWSTEESLGCPALLDEIVQRVRPRIHMFGHMHESRGASLYRSQDNPQLEENTRSTKTTGEILFVNLAIQQEPSPLAEPIVIDYFY